MSHPNNVDLLREVACFLRGGAVLSASFDGDPPDRTDPVGAPPWRYRLHFDPRSREYCLELTLWRRYLRVPATRCYPSETGWQEQEWRDLSSPVLACIFDELAGEGLPLPLA